MRSIVIYINISLFVHLKYIHKSVRGLDKKANRSYALVKKTFRECPCVSPSLKRKTLTFLPHFLIPLVDSTAIISGLNIEVHDNGPNCNRCLC